MSGYVGLRQGKVHESHVMSEYYCGGSGWPVTDHDSFCPECGGALKTASARGFDAEVAKLRTERDEWRRVAEAKQDIIDHMRDARAENAKLREELEDAPKCEDCEAMLDCYECLRADSSQKERKRLDYENAKLRELVRELYHELDAATQYDAGGGRGVVREFAYRMRELGIEVD